MIHRPPYYFLGKSLRKNTSVSLRQPHREHDSRRYKEQTHRAKITFDTDTHQLGRSNVRIANGTLAIALFAHSTDSDSRLFTTH